MATIRRQWPGNPNFLRRFGESGRRAWIDHAIMRGEVYFTRDHGESSSPVHGCRVEHVGVDGSKGLPPRHERLRIFWSRSVYWRVVGISRSWRLVEEQPILTQLPHGFAEVIEIHRVDDVAVNVQVIAFHDVAFLGGGGKNHDWDRSGPRVGLDGAEHFDPIDEWRFQMQLDQSGGVLDLAVGISARTEQEVEGLGSIANDVDVAGDFVLLERVECQSHIVWDCPRRGTSNGC